VSEDADLAWGLITRLVFAERQAFSHAAAEAGLTPMQAHLLSMLEPGRPARMGALAGQLSCEPSNLTPLVNRLEELGLAERRTAEEDRRVKTLALTEAGETARRRVTVPLRTAPAALRRLAPERQRELLAILREAAGQAP